MIYRIKDWTEHEPHWAAAFIEADTPEQAIERMKEELAKDPETVWKNQLLTEEGWEAVEVTPPFTFVLGSGCRW